MKWTIPTFLWKKQKTTKKLLVRVDVIKLRFEPPETTTRDWADVTRNARCVDVLCMKYMKLTQNGEISGRLHV